MDLQAYWKATLSQDAEQMRTFFHKTAFINWHNTNERFTVNEFIQANCEYPGNWGGKIERIERLQDLAITVVHVFSLTEAVSFHVTSFIQIKENKIISLDEYWGDDGSAPQWRLEKQIGSKIHPSWQTGRAVFSGG